MSAMLNYAKFFASLEENRPDHSSFAPSSADKWLKCFGYYDATKGLPSTPSGKAAKRGTKAHKLLEDCMTQNKTPEELSEDIELCDWVGYVLDYISAYHIHRPNAILFPEVYLPWLEVSGGTPDVLGLTSKEEILIIDLKTGTWTVEVENNTQLLSYAVAARSNLGRYPSYRMVIIQPNGFSSKGPIREWTITNEELDKFEAKATKAIIKNLVGGKRIAGTHCKWCKAEAICEARADYALKQADMALRADFLEE